MVVFIGDRAGKPARFLMHMGVQRKNVSKAYIFLGVRL